MLFEHADLGVGDDRAILSARRGGRRSIRTQRPGSARRGSRSPVAAAVGNGVLMTGEEPGKLSAVSGEVKWFDPRKGFGFIVGPQGQDIFVHFTVIEGDGFRVLKDGAKVEYDAERSDKGWKATRVVRHPDADIEVLAKRNYTRTPRR